MLCAVFYLIGPQSALAAAYSLNVQPVSVCLREVPASHCSDINLDTQLLRDIWRQADIDINVHAPTRTEPFLITRNNGEIDGSELYSQFYLWQQLQGTAANTVYVGFSTLFQNNILGLTSIGEPYVVLQSEGLHGSVVTYTAAHEIGHALGAIHDGHGNGAPLAGYLMAEIAHTAPLAAGFVPPLSDESITDAQGSSLLALSSANQPAVTSTPVPFSVLMLLAGMAGLLWVSNVRRS